MAIVPCESDGGSKHVGQDCSAKQECLDHQGLYGAGVRPVCPGWVKLKELMGKADVVPTKTDTSLKGRIERTIALCHMEAESPPSDKVIALWVHHKEALSAIVDLIQTDLPVLARELQKDYPLSAVKLTQLADELKLAALDHEMNRASNGFTYLEPPDYAQRHRLAFSGWRKERIAMAEAALGHSGALTMLRLTSTYPVDVIAVMDRIKQELSPIREGLLQRSRAMGPEDATEPTDTEGNILEALGDEHMTGPVLLKKAGYDYSSHYRAILSNLVKRGILGNDHTGYYRRNA